MLGLVGGPLLCAAGIAVMFGVIELSAHWHFLASIPEILWEVSLGIWLIARGFNASSPVLATPSVAPQAMSAD